MQIDWVTVICAIVAAVVLGRLWVLFGTKNEDEPQRPNPFAQELNPAPRDESFKTPPTDTPRLPMPALPPNSLAGGLAQVKAADSSFDEKQFLQNAGDIFTVVVGAYAAGTLDKVAEFLSPALRAHFQSAIDARTSVGQTAESRVARIAEADPLAARAEGGQIFVTVKFVSEQENILRDARGAVIGGEPGKTEPVTDIWTFARDTATPGAKWMVVETRG